MLLLFHRRWLIVCSVVTVTDELLCASLLCKTRLFVLHILHASPLLLLLTVTFGFLFGNALTLLLLTTLLGFLLLATALLFLLLTSFLFGCSFLGLLLCLHLGAHSFLIVACIRWLAIIFGRSTTSHNLRDVW